MRLERYWTNIRKHPIPFGAWLNQEFFIGYFIAFDRLLLDKLRENDLLRHLPPI